MFTYVLMGLPFIAVVLVMDVFLLRTRVVMLKKTWVVMVIMMLMTLVFDQYLTGMPIVHYNEAHMIGLRIGYAPVEDFMYTFAAVIGLGSLITHFEKN